MLSFFFRYHFYVIILFPLSFLCYHFFPLSFLCYHFFSVIIFMLKFFSVIIFMLSFFVIISFSRNAVLQIQSVIVMIWIHGSRYDFILRICNTNYQAYKKGTILNLKLLQGREAISCGGGNVLPGTTGTQEKISVEND